MTSRNGLVCFKNCLLPQEDGSLIQKDLWIDEKRGVVLDAQKTFYLRKERPDRTIDLGGNILRGCQRVTKAERLRNRLSSSSQSLHGFYTNIQGTDANVTSPGLIDIQLNGGYGFDFSVYDNDDDAYRQGMQMMAERIIETGVTSLVPTIITQEKSLYPKLLHLLRPFSTPKSATLLGWHAEGPFIELSKRGAHAPPFLLSAPEGMKSFDDIYGKENLIDTEDWLMASEDQRDPGVRIITAAPEIEGVMESVEELSKRGIVFSIGHSVASSDVATAAVQHGARLITHLFNAMPQLHHRDPSIIGLLGASPHLSVPTATPYSISGENISATSPIFDNESGLKDLKYSTAKSEAFDDFTPIRSPTSASRQGSRLELHLDKGQVADMAFERPFYGLIVDGIHCHPNSVRLAYSAFPEGCILISDAMKILDPNLKDGVHEWRDGKRFVKEGDRLYLEGTNTLAGSVVTLDKCVRNFSRFTGCSLGEAIKCATYNPAKCLGIENKKGTLRPGAHADLIVLDRQGIVLSSWVKGKEAWTRA